MQTGFFIDPERGRRPGAQPDAEVVYSYLLGKGRRSAPPAGWYWRYTEARGASKGGINGPYPTKEAGVRACRNEHGTGRTGYLELYDTKTDLWREG